MKKLYILVRDDLSPGLQLAQTAHAAFQFAQEHPEAWAAWSVSSNTVAVLRVADETELRSAAALAGEDPSSLVIEPDLDDQGTAVAILPATGKRFARLPLAGRLASSVA